MHANVASGFGELINQKKEAGAELSACFCVTGKSEASATVVDCCNLAVRGCWGG